jgi:hypothetical protein
MPLQSFPGWGLPIPRIQVLGSVFSAIAVDAAGEKAAMVFQVPKTGNIDRIAFYVSNVTGTARTIRVGLETIDSSGNPTGTQYGGSAVGTQASPASTTVYEVTLGTPAAATIGDRVAIVIQFDSTVGNMQIGTAPLNDACGFPYSSAFTASWAKQTSNLILCGIRYDDGVYEDIGSPIPGIWSSPTISSSTTPDEVGVKFSLPFPVTVKGVWLNLDLDGNATIKLYDSDGSTVLGSISVLSAERAFTSMTLYYFHFSTPIDLDAGTEYRLTLLPATTTAIGFRRVVVASADRLGAMSGGTAWYETSRTDAGAWTDTTTQKVFKGLLCSHFHDGAGGSPSAPAARNLLLGGLCA